MGRMGRTGRNRLDNLKVKADDGGVKVIKLDSKSEFIHILKWMWSSRNKTNFEKGSISPAEFYNNDSKNSCCYRGMVSSTRISKDATILYLHEEMLITENNVDKSISIFIGDENVKIYESLSLHEKFIISTL
jgi:hypothetical protein